jgi:hypothetical protein
MSAPLELKGMLAGKRIMVTSGKGGPSTVAQLRDFLRRFQCSDTLRILGSAGEQVDEAPDNIIMTIGGEAVPAHAIPYLALLAIEESSDVMPQRWGFSGLLIGTGGMRMVSFLRDVGMTTPEFERLIQMFHNLRDPISVEAVGDGDAGLECALRMAGSQFLHQGPMNYLVPRTLLLYRDIWPTVAKAKGVTPCDDLQRITGLQLDQILLFGKAMFACTRGGFFRPYSAQQLRDGSGALAQLLTPDAQARFLNWLSADYATIRANAKKFIPGNETYDPYRFNPLVKHPIVRPEIQPQRGRAPHEIIHLLPCRRLLLTRVTSGLYHELADAHAGDAKENAFRTAFGHVLQEYVGVLLRAAFGARVCNEWSYENNADTPDWFVIEGDKAVVIEVKQSGQFLASKMWGRLHDLRKDLRKTLGHALGQLHRFDGALTRRAPGLESLSGVRRLERLIISYDEISWANWILRDVAREVSGVPENFHAHLASVHDLERMLAHCWDGSLFDLLERKRLGNSDQAEMDFHDWLTDELDPTGATRNPFLEQKLDETFQAWGLEWPAQLSTTRSTRA